MRGMRISVLQLTFAFQYCWPALAWNLLGCLSSGRAAAGDPLAVPQSKRRGAMTARDHVQCRAVERNSSVSEAVDIPVSFFAMSSESAATQKSIFLRPGHFHYAECILLLGAHAMSFPEPDV